MASAVPSQTRVIDPFSSFNSDTVNQLTQMITRGNNALTDYNSLQVRADSIAPFTQSVVSPGSIYKDDVLITMDGTHTVDFTDSDHYVSFGGGFNEIGTYYIVLEYTYQKSRPAPRASIKILKPSQIPNPSLGTSLFFLKAVTVIFTGATFRIDQYYDYDPTTPSVTREYTPLYFGVVTTIPTHSTERDQGRVIYESETDTFWFGLSHRWVELAGGGSGVLVTSIDTDSTGVYAGCITYIDENKKAQPAIATGLRTRADIGVITVGSAALNAASATMAGTLTDVRVETGQVVGVGNILYLSETEAGKVTTVRPANFVQDVGRALTAGDDSTPIDMLFLPRAMLATSLKGTIYTTDWIYDATSGEYYYDIDMTSLDSTGYVVVSAFYALNSGVLELLQPSKVQLIDYASVGVYDYLRVWMFDDTLDVLYNISNGIGIPGSTGTSPSSVDHSLLLNLDYASSGHTGFAPDPHGSAYHSEPSVPINEIILFEKNTSVVGYSLQTDVDDQVVYITKGSVAGGETGGTTKSGSTWTQPNHSHTIAYDGSSHVHTVYDDGSHNHKWKDYVGANDERTWSVSGTDINLNSGSTGLNSQGIIVTDSGGTPRTIDADFYTDVDGLHDHGGETGLSDDLHNHGGSTSSTATVNTWRPLGRNFTRQKRIV